MIRLLGKRKSEKNEILVEMDEILLDSNIIIALANGKLDIAFLTKNRIRVSEMTRLEVFGYHLLTKEEKNLLITFFENIICLEISGKIIDEAINLRQKKNMSIGDSIIGATAIYFKLPLYTANTKDFRHLSVLNLIDPFK